MAESTLTDVTNSIRQQNEDGERRDRSIVEKLIDLNRSFGNYFRAQERARNEDRLRRAEERQDRNSQPKKAAVTMFRDAKKDGGFLGTIGAILAAATGVLVGFVQGLGKTITTWFKGTKGIMNGLLRVITKPFRMVGDAFRRLSERYGLGEKTSRFLKPVTEQMDKFRDFMRGIGQRLSFIVDNRATRKIGEAFTVVGAGMTRLRNIITGFAEVYRKAGTGQFLTGKTLDAFGKAMPFVHRTFERMSRFAGHMRELGSTFKSAIKSVTTVPIFLAPLTDELRKGGEVLNQIFGSGRTARQSASFIQTIMSVFNPISGLFRAFGALGRFLGGPVTLAIFTIIDGVMGAFKGFTDTEGGFFTKLLGGINGLISGVISGFVGGLLDLGKMLVGWIAGLFGFDDFKEKLASFSFRDMIFDGLMFPFRAILSLLDDEEGNMFSDLGQQLYDNLFGILEKIKNWFSDKVTSIGSSVAEFFDFGDDEPETPKARPTRGRTAKADQLAEQRAAVEAEKARTAGNVTIMDNSQNSTVSGGGGGGSPSLGTSSATDAHDPATSHI